MEGLGLLEALPPVTMEGPACSGYRISHLHDGDRHHLIAHAPGSPDHRCIDYWIANETYSCYKRTCLEW